MNYYFSGLKENKNTIVKQNRRLNRNLNRKLDRKLNNKLKEDPTTISLNEAPKKKPKMFIKKEKIIWYKSDFNNLNINFFLKEIRSLYEIKPLNYFNYLFNYKGEKSIYLTLKNEDLIYSINSQLVDSNKDYSRFVVSIDLTEKGITNLDRVIILIDKYINMIKSETVNLITYCTM